MLESWVIENLGGGGVRAIESWVVGVRALGRLAQ